MNANEIIREAHEIVKRDAGKIGLPKYFGYDPAYHKSEFAWAASLLDSYDLDSIHDCDEEGF